MSTDSYISIFFQYDIAYTLSLLMLLLFRILPIILFAPFLGGKIMPAPTKMGLSLFLALMFFPFVAPMSTKGLEFGFNLIPLSIKEVLIGFILGYLSTIPFNIVASTGSLIDHQRGSSSLMVTEPIMNVQTSPIGTLLNEVLIAIFFIIGGPFLFFDTLVLSYQLIPPDTYIDKAFFLTHNAFWNFMITLMHHVLALAAQFAAPALVAMLMADVFLGIANRLAPQVQIAFLGMPFKSLLGLALLFFGWTFILKQITMESMTWMTKIYRIIHLFQIH